MADSISARLSRSFFRTEEMQMNTTTSLGFESFDPEGNEIRRRFLFIPRRIRFDPIGLKFGRF